MLFVCIWNLVIEQLWLLRNEMSGCIYGNIIITLDNYTQNMKKL